MSLCQTFPLVPKCFAYDDIENVTATFYPHFRNVNFSNRLHIVGVLCGTKSPAVERTWIYFYDRGRIVAAYCFYPGCLSVVNFYL